MLSFLTTLQILITERVAATRDDRGATAVEYGLMVALIAAVIVVAVTQLGGSINNTFNDIVSKLPGTPAA